MINSVTEIERLADAEAFAWMLTDAIARRDEDGLPVPRTAYKAACRAEGAADIWRAALRDDLDVSGWITAEEHDATALTDDEARWTAEGRLAALRELLVPEQRKNVG